MPRQARVVVPGLPHHLTQRGNRGMDVFFSDADRQRYLLWLGKYARLHELIIWAYCLMDNHVHFIVVPGRPDSIAAVLRPLQTRHSRHINTEHEWTGHVWQGRYYSCPLDDDHLRVAIRYVERNPVRAGLVGCAEDFGWSSASAHCGLRNDPVLSPDLPLLTQVKDWAEWLREPDDGTGVTTLRSRTESGLPCGDRGFVAHISELTGRSFEARRPGRPRKN